MNHNYLARLGSTWKVVRYELKSYLCIIIGKVRVITSFSRNRHNQLEIGAGQSRKSGFIVCDMSICSDYPYDLRVGLPFPDHSIDLLYAEHVLEHFSYRDLVVLIADCYRVLRQDGIFSISVPDPKIYIDAFVMERELDLDIYAKYKFDLTFSSKIDYVNHIFYMDGQHRYMFDQESLTSLLINAGFRDVHMRDYDIQLDQESRKHMSLYASAKK